MAQEKFRTEVIGNVTLKAYVWETSDGWTSKGVATEDHGSKVVDHTVYPTESLFASKEEAGEAVWQALKNGLAQDDDEA